MPPGSVKMAISFQYDSVIRRYRIYKEIWEASHGETLLVTFTMLRRYGIVLSLGTRRVEET